MTALPLIFFGLFFLYLTRRKMTAELSKLINRCGGSASPADKQRAFIWLWSAIFLPGTIIHEVSHFLAAAMTGALILEGVSLSVVYTKSSNKDSPWRRILEINKRQKRLI